MKRHTIIAFGTLFVGVSALTGVANAAPGEQRSWQQQLNLAAEQSAEAVRAQDAAQQRLQTQQRLKDGSGQGQQHRYQHQYRYEHQDRGASQGQPQGGAGAMNGGGAGRGPMGGGGGGGRGR